MYKRYSESRQVLGEMEHFELNTGQMIPAVGLGTWQSAAGDCQQAVEVALSSGYRHIDCAFLYGNETEVGKGIQTKIADGTVTREDIFITSKLWSTFLRPDLVSKGFHTSLNDLQLSYVDLYLIHNPVALKEGSELLPVDEDGKGSIIDVDYLDTYKEMEKFVDEGLAKTIGLSNFTCKQVQRVYDNCRIKPSVNQVEIHPYFNQQKMIDFCGERGIHVTAFCPLGSPNRPWAPPGEKGLLQDPMIKAIGDKYNKSTGQVLIRYAVQRGVSVVPKSVTESRIEENIQVMDFKLSPADMRVINNMDRNTRVFTLDNWNHSTNYPFNDDGL